MRKPVTPAQKAEAIALAIVVGAEAAAKQLGWDPRSIRKWCEAAGRAPADAITSPDWRTLGELARSQVASRLATGKVSARDAAVIAGIATRNEQRPEPEPEPEATPEQQAWSAALEAALAAKYGPEDARERADVMLDDVILQLMRWRIHEKPPDELWDDPVALVAALPDDWDAWYAEREAKQAAFDAEMEGRRSRSEPAWTAYMAGAITAEQRDQWIRDGVDAFAEETARLLAAAEAFLRELPQGEP